MAGFHFDGSEETKTKEIVEKFKITEREKYLLTVMTHIVGQGLGRGSGDMYQQILYKRLEEFTTVAEE